MKKDLTKNAQTKMKELRNTFNVFTNHLDSVIYEVGNSYVNTAYQIDLIKHMLSTGEKPQELNLPGFPVAEKVWKLIEKNTKGD